MEIIIYDKGEGIILAEVTGEIIGTARFRLMKALRKEIDKGAKGIILDMQEVPMMDSFGLGVFADLDYSMSPKKDPDEEGYIGDRLFLLNVGRSVRYLLVIAKMDQYLPKYDDRDEALEDMKDILCGVAPSRANKD